jgi:putative sterol carrier protein
MDDTVLGSGKRFFAIMGQNPEAREHLVYDSCFQFNCGGKSFIVRIKNTEIREIKEGKHSPGLMDLVIEGDEETLADLFRGRISPATAFYYGKLRIPDQKSKHSQVVALFQAMRKTQEDLYREDWS